MKTLYGAIQEFTETKNVFVNLSVMAVCTLIAVTLIAVAIKIATTPEAIVIGNF